jgi:splicing factor 3A subunit 2|tara:strand:- start:169 stop:1188 length:1020 start_codon:yes stop_codon:yes gene_type:complete
MQIFLRSLTSRTVALDVQPGDTVHDLQRAIQHQVDAVPPHRQRLAFNTTALDDPAKTLRDYRVTPGATLRLALGLRGGIDFQHRAGSKFGGGGVMSEQQAAADRKERLRKLALETVDLNKDPYFLKNHLGTFECKLCLTLHTTEGNYLAHTQGKRHQQNLGRRAAREEKLGIAANANANANANADQQQLQAQANKAAIKIGRPGYKVTKSRDLRTKQRTLLFEVDYPQAENQPRHRFMSTFEQRVEAADKTYQFLLFACEPYETVAFKVPNEPLDKREGAFFTNWDASTNTFTLRMSLADPAAAAAAAELQRKRAASAGPGAAGAPKRRVLAADAGVVH